MSTLDAALAKHYPDNRAEEMHWARFFRDFLCWCWDRDRFPEDLVIEASVASGVPLLADDLPFSFRIVCHPNLAEEREAGRRENGGERPHPKPKVSARAEVFASLLDEFYGGEAVDAVCDVFARFDRSGESILHVLDAGDRTFSLLLTDGRGGIYSDEFYNYDDLARIVRGDTDWVDRLYEKVGRAKDEQLTGAEVIAAIDPRTSGDEEE